MTHPNGPFRYCIPCTYRGDEAFRNEAIAFVCGAIAAMLGVPTNYSLPDMDGPEFNVFVLAANYLYDSREPDLLGTWKFPDEVLTRAISSSLGAVLAEPGATVEVHGPPMLVDDALSIRLAAERAAQAGA